MLEKFRRIKPEDQEEVQLEDLTVEKAQVEELKLEAENLKEDTIKNHEQHYSNEGLWNKIQRYSKKAGSTVIYAVLLLYYTLQKPEVPLKVKATIAGALGYFILPIDLIPDIAAGVGYVDDLGVVTAALIQVAMHIDEDIKKQSRKKLADWFEEDIDTSDIDDKL